MNGKKRVSRGNPETEILVVPVIEGPEMERFFQSMAQRGGMKCGKCDRIAGITWCNVNVPKARYTISLTKRNVGGQQGDRSLESGRPAEVMLVRFKRPLTANRDHKNLLPPTV